MTEKHLKIGIIINPIAGMGGRVGLKGTDGSDVYAESIKRGAVPIAQEYMEQCITWFYANIKSEDGLLSNIEFLMCSSPMGSKLIQSDAQKNCPLGYRIIYDPEYEHTRPEDTVKAVFSLCRYYADIILFAGGDGTARDVVIGLERASRTGYDLPPILGVPAGVKMHSSVFALSPDMAGEVLVSHIRGETSVQQREILDIDEIEYRKGILDVKMYGSAGVSIVNEMVQSSKSPSPQSAEAELHGIAEEMADIIKHDDGTLYLLGAGSTLFAVKRHLGIDGTLLGIDAVLDGELLAKDIWEKQMLSMADKYPIKIVVTPIGRQGFLFGRGNQQFSPEVMEMAGFENVEVISTRSKIKELDRLFVFLGEKKEKNEIPAYLRVMVEPGIYRMIELNLL